MMGYSITLEQANKLDKNRSEGRLCHMSTGRGGCFNRATVRETHESFMYALDEGDMTVSEMTLCGRHAMGVGTAGTNFRVVASERF
jgi:hypothetical protein